MIETPPKPPSIPKPPSKQDLDQISRDQKIITDEWASPAQDPTQTVKPDEID